MKYALSFLLIMSCGVPAVAGTDAAAFLQAGVGAKALAMGGAFVSVADDPSALYWNPAGIGRLNKLGVTGMSQSLASAAWESQKDITPRYQFFGVMVPVNSFSIPGLGNRSNTFGFGVVSLSLSDIPLTYVDSSNRIVRDTFEDSENAYFFSYGVPLYEGADDGLYAGASLKYLSQQFSKVADARATGYDMDVGLLYSAPSVNLGLKVQRGASMTWATGRTDTSPLTTTFGISKKMSIARSLLLLGAVDIVQRQNTPLALNTGVECGVTNIFHSRMLSMEGVFLRAGVNELVVEDRYGYRNAMNESICYAGGAGLDLLVFGWYLQFDYAFSTRRLGDKATVSASIYF